MKEFNSTREKSSNQEKTVAKNLGMRQQSNSGATAFYKGDVIGKNILLECKTVMKETKSFSIKKDWLTKNKEEAFQMRKRYSALVFNFGDNKENYYVIDEKLFRQLVDYIDSISE